MANTEWVVVGISGVSCGGKSTLAVRLHSLLKESVLIQQDKYFLADDDPRHVPCELEMHHNDYDILSALDMQQMMDDIKDIIAGRTPVDMRDKRLLIVEGFTILNYKPIYDMCTLRYYIDLDYSECKRRRTSRTYEPADVPGYFDQYVWPRHLHNKEALGRGSAVTMLSGTNSIEHTLNTILGDMASCGLTDNIAVN